WAELREPQGSLAQEEKDASLFARIPHLSAISVGRGSVQITIQISARGSNPYAVNNHKHLLQSK
ncbi:hypothetical protein, partial [Paenibacillus tianmuensis]|uniref:hypothetical protein n=1 Tax=Paenibacillus tianmuensis TaxID=624147 RepID=UPI001C266396